MDADTIYPGIRLLLQGRSGMTFSYQLHMLELLGLGVLTLLYTG